MNTFGNKFRISIFGESHGSAIGVVMDGVPSGLHISIEDFTKELQKRAAGKTGTTSRKENDNPEIVSGWLEGVTTGAPMTIIFKNENTKSSDYSKFRDIPRPGHADYTAAVKHNEYNDIRGGGHFSGRMTLCLVAAGIVAEKIIEQKYSNISFNASISEIGGIKTTHTDLNSSEIQVLLQDTIIKGDSIGAIISCSIKNIPAGIGEPFFDSIESIISHLAFSIPGVRGIEFGDGFQASAMKGSEHNDCIIDSKGRTKTNGAGGINGGISNGNPVIFRIAFKPTSSIKSPQHTYNFSTNKIESLEITGRHDVCFALRCPVIVESIAKIAIANFL